jgi:effector-binding domain-containing protein
MGIRTEAAQRELHQIIPPLLVEVFAWLGVRGVIPAGAPFIRYHVINMATTMDVEVGVPVASALEDDRRVCPGALPASRYAVLIYTGVKHGFQGSKALIDWAKEQGIAWDVEKGQAFRGRYELFLTNPNEEPGQEHWETEVAIRLADQQPSRS